MPEITYILRFTHCDNVEIETQEYVNAADAWNIFRLFAEPDSSEIYNCIELMKYNWIEKQGCLLGRLIFSTND